MVDLVIHHGSCRDGFSAAWVAQRRYPDAEFRAGYFGEEPPLVTGRHVLILDFSYPRSVMEEMANQAASVDFSRRANRRIGRSRDDLAAGNPKVANFPVDIIGGIVDGTLRHLN